MRRGVLAGALGCALALVGCGAGRARPPIRVPAPAAAAVAEPALPAAPSSTLTVALEVELERVRAAIEATLPRREQQDWQLVTREGASPRIELRYFVERDPVTVKVKKGGLRTSLPLRYWADVRGAVKSPLPWHRDRWFDLDRPATWGTRAKPQHASLVVHTDVRLDPGGQLQVDSRIERLAPGDAPSGSFCVKAGIRLCVGKKSFADEVARGFEQRIEPEVREALADVDRTLERAVDLHALIKRAWRTLHCPWPLHRDGGFACRPDAAEQGVWLQLRPRALAAGGLKRSGKLLRVLVSLAGDAQVTRGPPPASSPSGLPAIESRKLAKGSALHVPVEIPYALISSQLALGLPSAELALGEAGEAKLVAARIVGARADGAAVRLVVELRLAGDVDAVLYAYAQPRPGDGVLELADLEYSAESERLFAAALPDVDHARLRAELARALRVELAPPVALAAKALAAAVERAEPLLRPSFKVGRVALSDLRPGPRGLAALLTIEARVRVAVAP